MFIIRVFQMVREVLHTLDQELPILCDCGHWSPKWQAETEVMTWGQPVTYCEECHTEYFDGLIEDSNER